MKISQLCIYPIKGLKAISLNEAKVLEKGFENDRRWMLVSEENKLISQRNFPSLTQFDIAINGENIDITKDEVSLTIPIVVKEGTHERVSLWGSEIDCIEPSKEWSSWFSNQISSKCKLVFMRESDPRKKMMANLNQKGDVSFADGYPYLVLGTGSVKFLNQKTEEDIPIDRFRANIIFDSEEAHIEDTMSQFQIGDVSFQMIKPCTRCTVITTDQKTGKKNPEPIRTLNTYRSKMNNIYFGMNAVALDSGIISIGDTLTPSS